MVHRAARLGFRVKEIPVQRVYPDDGTVPTKIHGWRPQYRFFRELIETVLGGYYPRDQAD
jgi:dolichol-phosphate mannosyltransferase